MNRCGFVLYILSFIFPIFVFTSCNSKNTSSNPENENISQKHYYQGKIQAEFVKQKLDGKLSSTCDYADGLKSGIEKKFYPDGSLYRTREYSNGIINGIEKRFYRNGQLKTYLCFKMGMPGKGLKEFDLNGNLKTHPELLHDVVIDRDYEKQNY